MSLSIVKKLNNLEWVKIFLTDGYVSGSKGSIVSSRPPAYTVFLLPDSRHFLCLNGSSSFQGRELSLPYGAADEKLSK